MATTRTPHAKLARIKGLTLADCLRYFDDKASERDKAIAALAPSREGEVEIDHALISEGDDNGAYVLAWVWADFAGTPFDKDDESIRERRHRG